MFLNCKKCCVFLNTFQLDMLDIFEIGAQWKHTLFVQIFNMRLRVNATILYFLNI